MKREYLSRSAVSPKLSVGKSKIHGTGVFAKEAVLRGEKLMEFGGQPISREEMLSGKYRIRSIWPVGEDRFIALPETDSAISMDEYLNHSCDANAWLDDEVTLTARRDIAAGEEITLDHGIWNFDDWYLDDDEQSCSCGVSHCRRKLTENDWRRADLQERYRGHFHPLVRQLME